MSMDFGFPAEVLAAVGTLKSIQRSIGFSKVSLAGEVLDVCTLDAEGTL
jgi:hypothetical protein